MNAMELARKKYRAQKRKETIEAVVIGFGMAMVMAGGIGLIHGFHPVTLGMVIVGCVIQVVAFWRAKI